MSYKRLIKKLERMFPEKKRIEHRPGACFLEQMIDHFSFPPTSIIADCDNLNCWAKGNKAKWAENEFCEKYVNDCKKCQESRGLKFRQRYIVRDGDDVEESRHDVKKLLKEIIK